MSKEKSKSLRSEGEVDKELLEKAVYYMNENVKDPSDIESLTWHMAKFAQKQVDIDAVLSYLKNDTLEIKEQNKKMKLEIDQLKSFIKSLWPE
jgi:methionine synthase II (cobalamin-independent)